MRRAALLEPRANWPFDAAISPDVVRRSNDFQTVISVATEFPLDWRWFHEGIHHQSLSVYQGDVT
jgi:hypothetical protein